MQSAITFDSKIVSINEFLLTQRLFFMLRSDGGMDLKDAFSFELSTRPTFLFHKNGLFLKANKPQLLDAIWKLTYPNLSNPENFIKVLDGVSIIKTVT